MSKTPKNRRVITPNAAIDVLSACDKFCRDSIGLLTLGDSAITLFSSVSGGFFGAVGKANVLISAHIEGHLNIR